MDKGTEKRRNKAYTLGQAADELTRRWGTPVSRQMVWNWVRARRIAVLPRVGQGWHRIAASEFDRFAERKTSQSS